LTPAYLKGSRGEKKKGKKSSESSEPRTAALLGLAGCEASLGEAVLMSLRFPD